MALSSLSAARILLYASLLYLFARMASERSGGRKLAQLMPDHIIRNEDFIKYLPVMYQKGETDEFGNYRTPS
jgi:hypothetical protein